MVSHGGANSVHECMTRGKPIVVVPLAYNQPLLAKLVERAGVGVGLDRAGLTVERCREVLIALIRPDAPERARARTLMEQAGNGSGAWPSFSSVSPRRVDSRPDRSQSFRSSEGRQAVARSRQGHDAYERCGGDGNRRSRASDRSQCSSAGVEAKGHDAARPLVGGIEPVPRRVEREIARGRPAALRDTLQGHMPGAVECEYGDAVIPAVRTEEPFSGRVNAHLGGRVRTGEARRKRRYRLGCRQRARRRSRVSAVIVLAVSSMR